MKVGIRMGQKFNHGVLFTMNIVVSKDIYEGLGEVTKSLTTTHINSTK